MILGDINIDLLKVDNLSNYWLDLMENDYGLSQLITEPTRTANEHATLIDHVFVSNPEGFRKSTVTFYSISDLSRYASVEN